LGRIALKKRKTVRNLHMSIALRRLKWHIHVANVEAKAREFGRLAGLKYNPNQPRVPAGNPDGGQWTTVGGRGEATRLSDDFSNQQLTRLVDVIRVCIAESVALSTDNTGLKTFAVTYLCAGGRTLTLRGIGHKFRGIVRDPFR
jgi:hypothetical protein